MIGPGSDKKVPFQSLRTRYVRREPRIWLPLQAAAYRRLSRWQVLLAAQVRRRHLHRVLHFHNWGRFQNQNYRAGWKNHQTAGLGHCRSREVQDNHFFLLQVRKEEPACRLSLPMTCWLLLLISVLFSEGHMASSWSTMSQTKNPLTMWNSGFRCLRRCAFDACLRILFQLSWRKWNHVMLNS